MILGVAAVQVASASRGSCFPLVIMSFGLVASIVGIMVGEARRKTPTRWTRSTAATTSPPFLVTIGVLLRVQVAAPASDVSAERMVCTSSSARWSASRPPSRSCSSRSTTPSTAIARCRRSPRRPDGTGDQHHHRTRGGHGVHRAAGDHDRHRARRELHRSGERAAS